MTHPNHYGVVIGITRYPGIGDLRGSVADAIAFHDWLLAGGGVPKSNVRLVITTDPAASMSDARPTKTQVDDALDEVNGLARKRFETAAESWNSSRLYFFMAGHGIMPGDGQGALLLANARRGRFGENIEVRAYADWYVRTAVFHELVVFADCCRNVADQARGAMPPFDDRVMPGAAILDLVGYAADQGRVAYEQTDNETDPDAGRGYFTRALLEGLTGAAAQAPRYTEVTGASLARYVRRAVATATATRRTPQRISMRTEWSESLVLARLDRPALPPLVTIKFPDAESRTVFVRGPDGVERVWEPVVGHPIRERLRPGLYEALTDTMTTGSGSGMFKVAEGQTEVTVDDVRYSDEEPPGEVGRLVVRAATPGTMIRVSDAMLHTVIRDVDLVDAELPVGPYEVDAQAGTGETTRLVRVQPGRIEELTIPVETTGVAPVSGTTSADPELVAAVQGACLDLAADAGGLDAGVVLVARVPRDVMPSAIADGMILRNLDGTDIPLTRWIGGETHLLTAPPVRSGGYTLRMARRPSGEARSDEWIEQTLCAPRGWQTLAFFDADDRGVREQSTSIHMTRLGAAWAADSGVSQAVETLLDGLRIGRIHAPRNTQQMLGRSDSDPMLGLLAAHALLRRLAELSTPAAIGPYSQTIAAAQSVVAATAAMVPDHPDVIALQARLRSLSGERPKLSVEVPPMLAASYWDCLLATDHREPAVVRAGSLAETIAVAARPGGPWLTWLAGGSADSIPERTTARSVSADTRTEDSRDLEVPRAVAAATDRLSTYLEETAGRRAVTPETIAASLGTGGLATRTFLPESLVSEALAGVRSSQEYITHVPLSPRPVLLEHFGARVLAPMAAHTGTAAPERYSTIYVSDSLLVQDEADQNVLAEAAWQFGLRAEPRPGDRLNDRVGSFGEVSPFPRQIHLFASADGADPGLDAWAVLQRYREIVRHGPARQTVHLEHILTTGVNASISGPSAERSSTAITADTGPGRYTPVSWAGAAPSRRADSERIGRRPVVAIVDAAVGPHPWLADRVAVIDVNEADSAHDPLTGPFGDRNQTARATFSAGLVYQGCPDVDLLSVVTGSRPAGATEGEVLAALREVYVRQLDAQREGRSDLIVDVVLIPNGYYSESEEATLFDTPLFRATTALRERGILVVAAAGDDALSRPMYPAAFAQDHEAYDAAPVVSVGATNPNGTLAGFTNAGPWVTCNHDGALVVSILPIASDVPAPLSTTAGRATLDPDDSRIGFAAWSSTAFAAAVFAGRAAALLDDDGSLGDITESAAVARSWRAVTRLTDVTRPA